MGNVSPERFSNVRRRSVDAQERRVDRIHDIPINRDRGKHVSKEKINNDFMIEKVLLSSIELKWTKTHLRGFSHVRRRKIGAL